MTTLESTTKRRFTELISIILTTISIIASVKIITTAFFANSVVDGISMEPTLYHGDISIMDRITYRLSSPKRFDIIAFTRENGEVLVKRVIGLPGETVNLDHNAVYINNKPLSEYYINSNDNLAKLEDYGGYTNLPPHFGNFMEFPVTVPENSYFVLGDNRSRSLDSRFNEIGFVHEDQIIGKVLVRILPLSEFTLLR